MKRIFSLYILAMIGTLTVWAQDFVLTGRVMDAQEIDFSESCIAGAGALLYNLRRIGKTPKMFSLQKEIK